MEFSDFLKYVSQPGHWEIAVAVLVLFIAYLFDVKKFIFRRNFPPGPIGVPVLGYLPFLSKNSHLDFFELSKKYGNVFSMRLGSEDVVVLNGTDVIREAFSKPEFLGRPPNSVFSLFIVNSPFFLDRLDAWQEQRKSIVNAMKDLGFGKTVMEEHITEEIRYFIETVQKQGDKPLELLPYLTASMSNNISALILGRRYDYNDPEREFLDKFLKGAEKSLIATSIHTFLPWILRLPFITYFSQFEKAKKIFGSINEFFMEQVKSHAATLDPNHMRDLIDKYIVEMRLKREKGQKTTLSEPMLVGTIVDLFSAGSETVRATLRWCFYIMAAFPETQRKVQREISEVLGSEKVPEFQDKKLMPFTQAVIMEIMRWKTIVPINLLKYTTADTTVGGYDIPKGTIVTSNFWAVHHDPKNWNNPESFLPERFLSSDGKTVIKSDNFIPFSLGKRICIGEMMANMEIFLYFVSVLQKFDIAFPVGVVPDFAALLAISYSPKPHEIRLTSRN